MSKEISKNVHKANLIKEYLWGVREDLVKSHLLNFIHGCHSAARLSDQEPVLVISTVTIPHSREVNTEDFSTRKPNPNLQGLNSCLAISWASFSTTNSPSQLGS